MSRAPEIYSKTPYEQKPYNITFPSTITSITTFYSSPTSITLGIPTVSGVTLQSIISGGIDGTDYLITARIVDSNGRKLEGCCVLKVGECCI